MGCMESSVNDHDNGYDSTWDDENEQHFGMSRVTKQQTWPAHRNLKAARDMQSYRRSCPYRRDVYQPHGRHRHLHNLYFYQNKRPSNPDGVYIDDYHKKWFGNYTQLEKVHSYIQWLFPTLEPGLNHSAHVLTPTEIRYFIEDKEVQKRLFTSYELMLDFYGIRFANKKTGEVTRAEHWKERFENLNRNSHNNLRITRILKCLGLLGLGHYQAPLVRFFLEETLVRGTLPQVKQSVLDYFMFAVLDKSQRRDLIRFAFRRFYPQEQFVWCPKRIQRRFGKEMTQKQNSSRTPDGARRNVTNHRPRDGKWKMKPYRNSARNNRAESSGRSNIDPRAGVRIMPRYNRVKFGFQNQNSVTY